MTRAETDQVKIHLKGKEDDFIVMAESVDAVKKWRKDTSIPLVDVVSSFDVFVTGKQGVQGQMNRASKSSLENQFDTSKDDDVVKKILEQGEIQEVKVYTFHSNY
jgi:ribosome maturation protein Sdo1